MVLHVEAHVVDFNLLDHEQVLLASLLLLVFVDTEYSCQTFSVSALRCVWWAILEHEVHLGIVDEHLVEAQMLLVEQSVDGEFRDDVLGTEEGVHLNSCDAVAYGILVHDHDVLEDECCEWFEVNLFESYLTLDLFGEVVDHLANYCGLHLWQLYRE